MGKRWGSIAAVLLTAVTVASAGPARADVTFALRDTGRRGGEPTLGVLGDGTIFFQSFYQVLRSTDEALTWTVVHEPPVRVTLDPYIHVDAVAGRILSSQLLGACQLLSISDDAGATWLEDPTQCGTGDHQKIGSGPWHAPVPAVLFPRIVYTCVNHVAQTACSVSADGGVTWGPLVTVFPGYDPTAREGLFDVPGFCGGLEGDPVSGPDGAIFLPREYCGRPFLAVSTNNGLTWARHYVAEPARALPLAFGGNNPAVTVADDGTVFYAWTGGDWRHHVARSFDNGSNWVPWLASPADVLSTTFPLVIAGAPGKVATAYLGTRDTPLGPDRAPPDARWHLFVSYSLDANSPSPTWTTVQLTPPSDPIMIGCIGRHGPECGTHSQMLDFNDVALLPDGRIAISYTDGCVAPACVDADSSFGNAGMVAIQTGGPVLR